MNDKPPAPPSEAIRALVATWRERARTGIGAYNVEITTGGRLMYSSCADELEAALSQEPSPIRCDMCAKRWPIGVTCAKCSYELRQLATEQEPSARICSCVGYSSRDGKLCANCGRDLKVSQEPSRWQPITPELRARYEEYRQAVETLSADHQSVPDRKTAFETRERFITDMAAGMLDPLFLGAVVPLSEWSIQQTGEMLKAHVEDER